MKKSIIVLIVFVLISVCASAMTYTPSNPAVGTTITFTSTSYSGYALDWTFGDGSTATTYSSQTTHYYKDPGTYTVKAVDSGYGLNDAISLTIHEDRSISISPINPAVGQTITITLFNAKSPPIRWNFGDGRTVAGPPNTNHTYNSPGSYTIKAYDFNGQSTIPVTYIVSVNNPKLVTWKPQSPYEGQRVYFTATHFQGSTLQWDFGDGTIIQGPVNMEHTYQTTGVYTIKAYDYYGNDDSPYIGQITVRKDNRKIVISNPNPGVGERVMLQAQYFHSENIFWDFGDGVTLTNGPIVEHIFGKAGFFTVRAVDYAGDDVKSFQVQVNISTSRSHTSSLIITGMELYFDVNKKSYLIVPDKTTDVRVKTIIKYEGTGILNAYWTIDGKPYKGINRVLSFGQSVEFDINKLPFLETGLHTISIRFVSPQPSFEEIPYIHLFVSAISNRIILIMPDDKETFSIHETPLFKWQPYPLAINYELIYSEKGEELFKDKGEHKTIKTKDSFLSLKDKLEAGKRYYWMLRAIDINGKRVSQSEVRNFSIVKNIFEAFEKKSEELMGIENRRYVLLTFEIKGKIIAKRYYLVRVFVNGEKANEFISTGKKLNRVETSVSIWTDRKNEIKLKVYEIGEKSLKLVSYKMLEI
jgi:PKD repeat protein